MDLKRILRNLSTVIAEEADRNPAFEKRVREALGLSATDGNHNRPRMGADAVSEQPARGRNRRKPAVLDPVQLVQESEQALRDQLCLLTVEQLKDIVADHGMDPSKLVMKWRTRDRIVNHIVEMANSRSRKGNAFRS